MAGWDTHRGAALLLPLDNIDTDQLIPARFMSTPRHLGYGDHLLHDLRRTAAGDLDPIFPLNQHPEASILITGPNFGSGSSREAAVYALVDAGIRVVISQSFGDIFASNAVNNGLLPARVDADTLRDLGAHLAGHPRPLTVDLRARTLRVEHATYRFELQDSWHTKLIKGWDDIDLTLQHAEPIAAYKTHRARTAPWTVPGGAD